MRSGHDGVGFDRIEPVFQRYVVKPEKSRHEIWSFCHPIRQVPPGKTLRLIIAAHAAITWSADGWATVNHAGAIEISALKLWFAELPTTACAAGAIIEFTFFWQEAQRWEGRNYSVAVGGSK